MAVTVTPGSTAPLSSVTRPLSCAVACADAGTEARRKRTTPSGTSRRKRRMPILLGLLGGRARANEMGHALAPSEHSESRGRMVAEKTKAAIARGLSTHVEEAC